MNLTLFLHLTALPAWLALDRDTRNQTGAEALAQAGEIDIRHFDAEAFTAQCSDIVMLSGGTLDSLYSAMERLRDTALFAKPYFQLDAIFPAVEDGYRQFEAAQ